MEEVQTEVLEESDVKDCFYFLTNSPYHVFNAIAKA